MEIFLLIPKTVLLLLVLVGIVLVLFGLPEPWLIAAGALIYAIFFNFDSSSSDF